MILVDVSTEKLYENLRRKFLASKMVKIVILDFSSSNFRENISFLNPFLGTTQTKLPKTPLGNIMQE